MSQQTRLPGPGQRPTNLSSQDRMHAVQQHRAPYEPGPRTYENHVESDSESDPEQGTEAISFVGSLWNLAKDAKDLAAKQLDTLLEHFPFKQQQQQQHPATETTNVPEPRANTEILHQRHKQPALRPGASPGVRQLRSLSINSNNPGHLEVLSRASTPTSSRPRSLSESRPPSAGISGKQDRKEQVSADYSMDRDSATSTLSRTTSSISSTSSALDIELKVSSFFNSLAQSSSDPKKGLRQKKSPRTSASRAIQRHPSSSSGRNSVKSSSVGTRSIEPTTNLSGETTEAISHSSASASSRTSSALYPKYPAVSKPSMPRKNYKTDALEAEKAQVTSVQDTSVVASKDVPHTTFADSASSSALSALVHSPAIQQSITSSPPNDGRLDAALQEIAALKQQMGGQIEDIMRRVELLASREPVMRIERTHSAPASQGGPPSPPPPPPMTPVSAKKWLVPQSAASSSMQNVLDQLRTTPIQLKKTNSPFIRRRSAAMTSTSNGEYTSIVFASSQEADDGSGLAYSPLARKSLELSIKGRSNTKDPSPPPRTPIKSRSQPLEVGKSPGLQWPSAEALMEAKDLLDTHSQELAQNSFSNTTSLTESLNIDDLKVSREMGRPSTNRADTMTAPIPNPFAAVSRLTRPIKRTFSDISMDYPEVKKEGGDLPVEKAVIQEEPNNIFMSPPAFERERSGPRLDYKMRKPMPSSLRDRSHDRSRVKTSANEPLKRIPLRALPISTATISATPPLKTRHVSFQEEDPAVVVDGRWHSDYDNDSWRVSDR